MKSDFRHLAALSAVFLAGSANAFAQPAPSLAPMAGQNPALAPLDNANWRAIRVKNVRPSMLAHQIDPAHNNFPTFFNIPGSLGAQFRQSESEIRRIAPPQGVFDALKVVAADEQNLLFVAGDDAAQLAQLQQFVSVLDQPVRQVEIEAQMVELPAAELKEFGIESNAATAGTPAPTLPVQGALQIGFVRGDFQKRINDLLADNKAKVISTKSQIIINNNSLAVSLRTGPIDNTGANQYKMPPAPAEGTDTIVTLTPTINGDDTITVLMNLATLPAATERSDLTTVFNARNGDTIALLGLKAAAFPRLTNPKVPTLGDIPLIDSTKNQRVPIIGDIPLIGGLFRSKTIQENERTVLVFVTARIVRTEEN